MANNTTGYGAQIWLKVGAGSYVKCGELIALDPGAMEWETVETTDMESASRVRTYIKSLRQPGTGNFQINWKPSDAVDVQITAAVDSIDPVQYRIVYPGTTTNPSQKDEGYCHVLSRTPSVPLNDRMTCTVSMQFTGLRNALVAA